MNRHVAAGPLRVLVVTNMYPTAQVPTVGTFNRDYVESLDAVGVSVDLLHLDRRARGRRVYGGLAAQVRERLAASPPAVVHVLYGGVTADVVTRAAAGTPVVITFFGTDLLGGYEPAPLTRLRRRYGVRASHRAAARAAGVVAVAHVLAESLPPSVDRGRIWTIPIGIDLARFAPTDAASARRALGWRDGTVHLLFPSSPGRVEKRYELADAAAGELRRRGHAVELHALEGVDPVDVPTWLNASDVVLLTSSHEGSPNAVKEALACNVRVVSVDVGDVRERLAGLQGSRLAGASGPELADAVEHVLAVDRSEEGRASLAELDLPRIAERYRAVYDAVSERGRSG